MNLSDAIDLRRPLTIDERQWLWRTLLNGVEVDEATGCWIWQRAHTQGYGQMPNTIGRANPIIAHRASICLFDSRTLSTEEHVDHLCRVRDCVNPEHLEVVTQAENNRRAAAVRVKATICPRGHELEIRSDRLGRRRTVCRPCRRMAYRRARCAVGVA